MLVREQFKSNMDYIAYKIVGRVPKYLEVEESKKDNRDVELVFYKHRTGNDNRGMVICKDLNRSLCSCYEKDFSKIQEQFHKEFNGKNFEEISKRYKDKYNLKVYGKNGKRRIEKLEDCNIRFNHRKGTKRIDVRTHLHGKEYALCRCYEYEIPQVRKDFKRMQNNPNFTIEKVRDKLSKKYNLRQNTPKSEQVHEKSHSITITTDGMIYQDGKFVKNDNELYRKVHSLI